MSSSSSSRTPSRVGTPIPGHSPARLAPPPARPVPSLTNLRVYSYSASQTPVSISPPTGSAIHGRHEGADSSASSAVNVDAPIGIMVNAQEPDAEVDMSDAEGETAPGLPEEQFGDEESKKALRAQLRRTLASSESTLTGRRHSKILDLQEMAHALIEVEKYQPRQYFVLTNAGKPVFVSHQENEQTESFTSTIGVIQALVSVFLDDGDKLRCINAGRTRIIFLLRSPLYYVCVSSWGEPESVTRFHLEYLHLQILSVVSAEQLRRMFERRTNFDLRRLLSGAEPFLHSLLARLEWDLAMSTSSLHCLKLDPALRKSIADILVPTSKIKDVLYVMLIAQGRVVTLIRPKKHSIHPSDLHILINTVHSPSIINNSAAASWLPVCLPKYNPAAFVNAYVTFLGRDDEGPPTPNLSQTGSASSTVSDSSTGVESGTRPGTPEKSQPVPDIALLCVSGSAEFEAVRNWCDSISQRLQRGRLLDALTEAIHHGQTEYSVSDLGIPGLRHFLYKSRAHVQATMPLFEDPYNDLNEKRRLVTLYQTLYDAIHAKSGQQSTLKLQYIRTERESVMGWITQGFEVYLAISPLIPKVGVVGAANSIARWVQKEEKRLFLRDAPVF
ncbi:hypothetical protein CERSUDRAFT_112166 [Gelatoporia subvermispora B]|uniref:Vacuolar fusion protein MON1 n=1 Tax=Ceriporiopsis subvermispora (strain B) TaxID=914234 RepID=M2RNC4_CERS8|nr:hypothetical protein CERSUDRAFT_112166 [Gelatoporia subvermispora B]